MRLNDLTVNILKSNIYRSSYRRSGDCTVVHLGVGAFHKAHQAVYFDRLMDIDKTNWMIQGASIRRPVAANQLNPQDGIFTLVERNGDQSWFQIVRSIKSVIDATAAPDLLVQSLSNPKTVLTTLTITEKGYNLHPSYGELNFENPSIIADINNLSAPVTAIGYLVAGLANRWRNGDRPFTVLSCDNISMNGQCTRRAVLDMSSKVDTNLSDWINAKVAFPSSMVDRIVPATTSDDIQKLESSIGMYDEALVNTEPFSQWVIEDNFCNIRPPLEKVGVQFTTNVEPYEKLKLRLLNAAHSTLAYLGSLAGYEYVHQAIDAPWFLSLIEKVWNEAETTLDSIESFEITSYRSDLISRFKNKALQHRTEQIAIDGSQKICQRILNSIKERRNNRLRSPILTLSVAGWIRWLFGSDESGKNYKIIDPLAEKLKEIVETNENDFPTLVRTMITFEPVFGTEFASDSIFEIDLCNALSELTENGVATTVEKYVRREAV